jgi:hypothetical protein
MMTLILAILYPIAIQYEREKMPLWVQYWFGITVFPIWARYICAMFAIFALIIDVIANWTELSIVFLSFPKRREYTFSDRLARLVNETGWRTKLAIPISKALNYFAYKDHIPLKKV